MKKAAYYILLAGITGFVSCTYELPPAHKEHAPSVPQAVLDAFGKTYSGALNPAWEEEGPGYQVEFLLNGTEYEVTYSGSGEITESEHEIQLNQLPEVITSYITRNFAGYTMQEAKSTLKEGKEGFEVEITMADSEKELTFDRDGNFISAEDEAGDEDESHDHHEETNNGHDH